MAGILLLAAAGPAYLPPGLGVDLRAALCPSRSCENIVCLANGPRGVKPGYYKRPAAAVERGGGFYVPGLEGYKLRLAAASLLSVLLVLNRVLSPDGQPSQLGSEALGGVACGLLFVQVALDKADEEAEEREIARAIATSRLEEKQELAAGVAEDTAERAAWVAATALRLTPASLVQLLDTTDASGSAKLLLRSGRYSDSLRLPMASAVRDLIADSQDDGRVYLPELDEAQRSALALPPNIASALVQKCGATQVLLLASQRAGAFTEKHLLNTRSLANYIANSAGSST